MANLTVTNPTSTDEQNATWKRFEETYRNTPQEKRGDLLKWYLQNFRFIGARHTDIIRAQNGSHLTLK